jgi:hypothetical protein
VTGWVARLKICPFGIVSHNLAQSFVAAERSKRFKYRRNSQKIHILTNAFYCKIFARLAREKGLI